MNLRREPLNGLSMGRVPDRGAGPVADQAHGLRQLFARPPVKILPVLSNPFNIHEGLWLERLCGVFSALGQSLLVINAGERAAPLSELARLDLSAGIESLGRRVAYLSASDWPRRYLDARGKSCSAVTAACKAAPEAQIILIHAPAAELVRLGVVDPEATSRPGPPSWVDARGQVPQLCTPLVIMESNRDSVTHAYAGLKWMQGRSGMQVFDLMLGLQPQETAGRALIDHFQQTVDQFLGAVMRESFLVEFSANPLAHPDGYMLAWGAEMFAGAVVPEAVTPIPSWPQMGATSGAQSSDPALHPIRE